MGWLGRKTKDPAHVEELAEHKAANQQTVSDAKNANANLKRLLLENHFTVNIAAAMGAGRQVREMKHNGR